MPLGKTRFAMIWIWNGLRLPMLAFRFWRGRRGRRIPILDPRSLNAHWRRDLGFDS
jgi:hypothetical protein